MTPAFNFARRPFRDERPVFLAAGAGLLLSAVLGVANVRQYSAFHHEMQGTTRQIEYLEARRNRAARGAEQVRAALASYSVSSLAEESRGLLRVVAERRFSWTALLARLERTLPAEVRVARMTPRVDASGQVFLALGLVGKSPESVVRTIAALSRDRAFGVVELRSEATPEQGAPEGYSFELSLGYGGEAIR